MVKKKKRPSGVGAFTSMSGPINMANTTNHAKKYGNIDEKTWILPFFVGLVFLALFLFSKKIEDPWIYFGVSIFFLFVGIVLFFWERKKK